MFIRDLDEADRLRQRESRMLDLPFQSIFEGKEDYRWSVFQDKPAEVMYRLIQGQIIDGELQGVFPFIKTLHENSGSAYAKYMNDAIFKIPTPQLLQKIVTELDEIVDKQPGSKTDAQGDLYEYMLSKLSTAGTNGQFRTPRHIIRMMVELLDLQMEDRICDPACGTRNPLVPRENTSKKPIWGKTVGIHTIRRPATTITIGCLPVTIWTVPCCESAP